MTDPLTASISRRVLLGLLTAAGLGAGSGALAGCSADLDLVTASIDRSPAEDAVRPTVVSSVTSFTGRVLAALDQTTNLVCSPLSISIALAMVRKGAAGITATEMDAALGYPALADLNTGLNTLDLLLDARSGTIEQGSRTGEVQLSLVNQVFGDQSFTWATPFLEVLARSYGTGVARADFVGRPDAERRMINEWVADQTNDTITDLLAPEVIDELTRMVLVNAIYLKAPWLAEFQTAEPGDFTTDSGRVEAQLMSNSFVGHGGPGRGWTAARIPYLGEALAMTVILPDAGAEDQLVGRFGDGELGRILNDLPGSTQISLTMPKWSFRSSFELTEVLSQLGMSTAFTDRAEFPGLTADAPMKIEKVLHQGFIAVDEQGTEASAATAVVAGPTSGAPSQDLLELRLDRPFWFVIHDLPTATPLLAGRVADPTSQS